jgi:eukaryotic-like serine/threonine-protein kinase
MVGTTVSHYRIVGSVGSGGMGLVYLAEDTRLNRKVALKFLPPALALDPHARARFLHEAQAASALDHPNIATVYEIGDWNDQLFISMAYYDGATLRHRLQHAPLPIAEAIRIAAQMAAGLAAAHRAGIVHRDLKPANVMLSRDGQVKILDFGLAKVSAGDATATRITGPGVALGTVGYMAPEQALGDEVDARADIWALGVTLFEMLTGRLPFLAESAPAMLLAIGTHPAPRLQDLRPDIPTEIARLVDRALEKDVGRRTLSAADIVSQATDWQTRTSAPIVATVPDATKATWWRAVAAIVVIAAVVSAAWFVRQNARVRWAREVALPEIDQLIERESYVDAFRLATEAKRFTATDPVWARLDPILARRATIHTTPDGARACYRRYGVRDDPWTCLGDTPIVDAAVPNAVLAWRVEKAGFEAVEDVSPGGNIGIRAIPAPLPFTLRLKLHSRSEIPPGMVYVPAEDAPFQLSIAGLDSVPPVKLRDFWIDRTEVTNRSFKRFVDAGGYREPKYWRTSFVKNGRAIPFDEAVAAFTDSAGRPGPATWEAGSYPEGQDDFPVSGVSWYEAAAYAVFAGKALPTVYHWNRVAAQAPSGTIVSRSNFGGRGPMKAGASGGVHRFGAVDMAGNVKEWCWTRADANRRYLLGGAWDEPVYMFNDVDARSPFDRGPSFGFRCVKYTAEDTLGNSDDPLIAHQPRDFRKETPATDERFEAYLRLYDYDRTDLEPTREAVDETEPSWRLERVSFRAAYGSERVPALLFLPKRAQPPYQAVVYFPGSGSLTARSSAQINARMFDWIVKSGRALVFPIYKSTFERGDGVESDYPNRTIAWRDHVIAWAKDVRRTVDYLETRKDIDRERIAFMGFSWGASMAPIYVALEPRFKTAVLILGAFYLQGSLPEVDAFNFASRVRVPVLVLSGRFDFAAPADTSQLPMFELFRPPNGQKRRVVYDTGHNIPRPELIKESLDWLDTYVGKVRE